MAENVDRQHYKKFKDMYEGLMKGDIEKVLRQYDELPVPLPDYLTVFGDTLLHIAIYMKHEDMAREILKKYVRDGHYDLIRKENNVGDTVLHEVAATNMVNLARDLLLGAPKLLSSRNTLGETPLFKAAYNGQLEMFDVLSLAVNQKHKDNLNEHLIRKDKANILHITILAEFFNLAFKIARNYPHLVEERDGAGKIGLQLLANNPSAFPSSRNYGLLKKLILKFCVPTSIKHEKKGDRDELDTQSYELDSFKHDEQDNNIPKPEARTMPRTCTRCKSIVASVLTQINISIWTFLRGWPTMERIYRENRKHELAFRLAKLLIKSDVTWEFSHDASTEPSNTVSVGRRHDTGKSITSVPIEGPSMVSLGKGDEKKGQDDMGESINYASTEGPSMVSLGKRRDQKKGKDVVRDKPPASLLIAASNGIIEIVKEILRVYPQAVEYVSDAGQNILHIAIKHRQLEIFYHIIKMKLPMSRLVKKIDNDGYTILHQVADISNYSGGTLPGPALQLQEELHWFQRVREIVPNHYLKHRSFIKEESLSKKKKKTIKEDEPSSIQETERIQETALELFDRTHKHLLEEAGEWLKNTSESCSTVAVLIATVAFAAAYTVPGGSDSETGAPILLHDPFFLVFTVTDVLSLATSLTSVVMFLSILTSPFELQDFEESLPRKLILGFTFLFISVAMTMLAFAATIVLTIHLKKRWVTTLVYCLAFLPVAVFALLQYPLYVAFMATVTYSWNIIKHSLPPVPKWFSKYSPHKSD